MEDAIKQVFCLTDGAKVWVNENTTIEINGERMNPFPRLGVVDDTGTFREATQAELDAFNLRNTLRLEAAAARSPVSLQPDTNGEFLVFIGRGWTVIPHGTQFSAGTVTPIPDDELNALPFLQNGTINGMPVQVSNGIVARMSLGDSGTFRARGPTKMYRIAYNYGYDTIDSTTLNVDGTVYRLE